MGRIAKNLKGKEIKIIWNVIEINFKGKRNTEKNIIVKRILIFALKQGIFTKIHKK